MNWTFAQPFSTYYAAYCDPIKSLPHRGESGIIENPRGLAFWIPEQRYVANMNDYLSLIDSIEKDEFTVVDPVLEEPLVKFYVEKGKSAIWNGQLGNGMILFQYTEHLMAYRKREDGLLGIESISGLLDTRLSTVEKLKYPQKFPAHVPSTSKDEANFSSLIASVTEKVALKKENAAVADKQI